MCWCPSSARLMIIGEQKLIYLYTEEVTQETQHFST